MNLRSARKIFLRSPATYRPMVRWLWNDHLDPDRLSAQMDQLLDIGMGGALIRPASGLPPGTYLSDSWFEAVTAVARRARKRRASLWIAEDLDDPTTQTVMDSILRDAPKRAAQVLTMEDLAPGAAPATADLIAAFEVLRESSHDAGHEPLELRLLPDASATQALPARRLIFRETTLPGRLRLFEPDATLELLQRTHRLYHTHVRKYFGNTIGLCLILGAGAPHTSGSVPWDGELPALFHETYGYDLAPNLPALFFDLPGCEALRSDYWGLVDEMLREGFDGPFARWAEDLGIPHACAMPDAGILDHAVARGGRAMARHATHNFAALATKRQEGDATAELVACIEARSVTRQLGIEGVVEIAGANALAMRHIAQGVHFLAARTVVSSLRGDRKHAASPLLVPADDDAHTRAACDAEARFAWMLGQGRAGAQTLLIHPYTSLQASYRAPRAGGEPSPVHHAIARHFGAITRALTEACIEFDFGDEALLAKHGRAGHKNLRLGSAEYRIVVLPPLLNLRSSTLELLHDFATGGGLVLATGSLPELVDGRGSDRVLRFFVDYGERVVQGVDFGRYRALVERLKRSAADTRLDPDTPAAPVDRVLIQRRFWDEIGMIGLHHSGERAVRFTLAYLATVTGRAESWDPLTGAIEVLGPATIGAPLAQSVALGPGATSLIVTTQDAAMASATPPIEETRMTPAWAVRRADPNIAVLRECRLTDAAVPGEWTTPEALRSTLTDRLTKAQGPAPLRAQWRFRVESASAPITDCSVAAELGESGSVTLDGAELLAENDAWRLDPAIRLLQLPVLSAGEHLLETWRLYSAAGDYQPPWIQGPFANLSREGGLTRIAAARDALTPAEVPAQGFHAYFGDIVYAARVDGFAPGEARQVELRMPGLRNTAEIRIDGARVGFSLPPRESCDLTDAWRAGSRVVEIVIKARPDALLAALRSEGRNLGIPPVFAGQPEIVVLARRKGSAR